MRKRAQSLRSTPAPEVSLAGKAFSSVFTVAYRRDTGERRYRITGSGVQGRPYDARCTARVLAALREQGVAVREYSMGSPANVDSFHVDAKFKDGGLTASTGTYWYSERGAWITGEQAVDWVASLLQLRPRPAETTMRPPKVSDGLLSVYRETDYIVLCDPEVHIRVGSVSTEVDQLLERHRAESAILITAWNPFGQRFSSGANDRRNAELAKRVAAAGLRHVSGEGRDPAGVWLAEASLLVFDLPTDLLDSWLVDFEQHAAVRVQKSDMATLVMHPIHRGTQG